MQWGAAVLWGSGERVEQELRAQRDAHGDDDPADQRLAAPQRRLRAEVSTQDLPPPASGCRAATALRPAWRTGAARRYCSRSSGPWRWRSRPRGPTPANRRRPARAAFRSRARRSRRRSQVRGPQWQRRPLPTGVAAAAPPRAREKRAGTPRSRRAGTAPRALAGLRRPGAAASPRSWHR